MKQTITLDTSKAKTPRAGLFPLRRGERNNVDLTVAVRSERRTYDLVGMTAHLVWQAADGKLVGPIPMEADTEAVEFSHVFMLEDAPALVWVSVINGESGKIYVKLVLLAKEAS